MKKSNLYLAISGVLLGASSFSAHALSTGDVLAFDPGETACSYGGTPPDSCSYGVTEVAGSYFAMDTDGNGSFAESEKTKISMHDGLIVGTTQDASGSHGGLPDGSESPTIDEPWGFFKNTGMHESLSDTNILSDDGAGNVELDFSGWSVTWNGIPSIDMGGGFQDCGDTADGQCVTNSGDDLSGTFNNGTGIATLTCGVDCAVGDTFVLDYAATVPQADPSNFGGVSYALHLEGTVAPAIPVPAAVWLMGSGLLGLVGVARRKSKTA